MKTFTDKKCPKCDSTEFETVTESSHPLIVRAWGPDILICHGCGAVRYERELQRILHA